MPAPDYAAEIAQLVAGIAGLEAEIQQTGGERVQFRKVEEMKASLTFLEARRDAAGPTSRSSFGFSAPAYSRE